MNALRRGIRLALAAALLSSQGAAAELGDAAAGAAHPAYRAVEGVSDGVYDFLRSYVLGPVLPDHLLDEVEASPADGSEDSFARAVNRREEGWLQSLRAGLPASGGTSAGEPEALRRWRARAAQEQAGLLARSLRDALTDRYRLPRLGRDSARWAGQEENWSPGFAAVAGVVGGAALYLDGLRFGTELGDLRFGLDVRSGLRIQRASASEEGDRVGGIELGYKGVPLTLAADCGLARGGLRGDRVGLTYRLTY